VFEEYTWKVCNSDFLGSTFTHPNSLAQREYYPWQNHLPLLSWQKPTTPLNALLSGSMVGGPWEPGDNAPRSVHLDYWEKVCPPEERTIIMSNTLKDPVREAQGDVVFKHMVDQLKKEQGRCVEIQESPGDNFPQTFDLWLIGDPRGISMSKLFLNTATSRLFGTSPLVDSALVFLAMFSLLVVISYRFLFISVLRNEYLILPKGPKNINAPTDPYERMMAVHIRRGDFGPACKDRALWSSTYYQWYAISLRMLVPDRHIKRTMRPQESVA
jgi:hypothetical protein